MSKRCVLVSVLVLLLMAGLVGAAETGPLPGLSLKQAEAIIDAASGDLALNYIRQLALHHRWFVSDGYLAAASYVRDQAEAIGLRDARVERFPSDGKVYYSTEKSLPKWTVRSASLQMVAPISRHIVSWAENPIVLASNSRSADMEAELVDVGEGVNASDYQGKDVRGKLVLASSPQAKGRIEVVHRMAVLERGAAGVVSYRSYYLDDFPDLVTWDHIWTLELNGKMSTFGFCVSKRAGWELKRLLQGGGKVVLHAKVDADLSAGDYGVVTASIPGTDLANQEIWFVAHLDHTQPSANDNASGSAAILETARVLQSLFDSKVLPRPRRTLRFLWVPEIRGSYAYISRHLDETRRAVAVVNMDMVGENQELCGSVFRVTRTVDSSASFLNDMLEWNLDFMLAHDFQPGTELSDPLAVVSPFGAHAPWRAVVIPYSEGSDHDVFMGGVVNIPATMLGSWPDFFYHSSGDTPDKSDPTQLKRAIVYGAMLGASIAGMDGQSALALLERMRGNSAHRLQEAVEEARQYLRGSRLEGADVREAENKINSTVTREARTFYSVGALNRGDNAVAGWLKSFTDEMNKQWGVLGQGIESFYRDLCNRSGRQAALPVLALTREEQEAKNLVPVRNPAFPGPIVMEYVAEKLPLRSSRAEDPFHGIERYEIGAFIDGTRSALDIRDAVSAECGPVSVSDVLTYLKVLADTRLISFRQR